MTPPPEFSRPIRLDHLSGEPRLVEVEADANERAALADRFGIVGIDQLDAGVRLVRDGEVVRCEGRLHAAVTQACVASGAPVQASLDEPFAVRFVPEEAASQEELELDEGDLDDVLYTGASVDVGEAAAQTLALALDPFPRAPNADAVLREAGVVVEDAAGPFSALRALKDRLGRN